MDASATRYDKHMAVVQKIIDVYDPESSENKKQLQLIMQGKEQSFMTKDETVIGDVEEGDVIRISLSSLNEIDEIQHIYDRSKDEPYLLPTNPYLPETQNKYFSKERVIYANAYSTDKGLLRITMTDPAAADLADLENCYMSKF